MFNNDPLQSSETRGTSGTTDKVMAELWKEVLQLPALPEPNDNFFALGGDSMTIVMLEFRIKEELGIDVSADAMLAAQTLHELSELIKADLGRNDVGCEN